MAGSRENIEYLPEESLDEYVGNRAHGPRPHGPLDRELQSGHGLTQDQIHALGQQVQEKSNNRGKTKSSGRERQR